MSQSRPLLACLLLAISIPLTGGLAACDRAAGPGPAPAGRVASSNDTRLMLQTLAEAPTHGFRPGAFGETGLAERLKHHDPDAPAALRRAIIAYAQALHGRAIPVKQFDANWGLRPAPYDAAAALDQALARNGLRGWLSSLPPPSDRYRALRAGYLAYGRILAAGGWRPVSEGAALKPGSSGARVAELRARLAAEDPSLAPAAAPASSDAGAAPADRFDAALSQAVDRARARYGLKPTGVADKVLITQLNVPVETRIAQIRANLERLRWLPRDKPATRIEVNTAAGLFDLYRDGRPALHMLAIAGKPGDESPMLTSAIETVVLNPEWRVPDSIADEELLPKAARNPGYLARHHFVRNDQPGVKLIQQPGPDNALGRVKFLFPNDYSVYLHDTPSHAAFSRTRRSISHGCVRLQRPIVLAKLLLSDKPGWSAERVDRTLQGHETTAVSLDQKLPVTLVYLTAFPASDGTVSFRPDIYGWDSEVLRLLDAAGPGKA